MGGGGFLPPAASGLYDLGVIPARFESVEFANEPSTSFTDNVTNQTELNDAIAAGNGRRINVAAGSYTSLSVSGSSDLDFVLANTASFSGSITITNGTRIRVTGGDINGGTYSANINEDSTNVILDNINLAQGILFNEFDGRIPSRVTVMNTSVSDGSAAGFGVLGRGSHFIFANCDIVNTNSTVAGVRLTSVQNVIWVDSRIYTDGNRIFRLHADHANTDLVLLTRMQYESPAAAHTLWLGPDAGGNPGNLGISRVEFHNSQYYNPEAGSNGVCQCDTNVAGGIDDVIVASDFIAYSPDTQFTNNPPTNYTDNGDYSNAYTTPPTFNGGADH